MKYQVKVTENGQTRIYPAMLSMEDAKWEIKMQKWMDDFSREVTGEKTIRTYEIIEA